MVEGETLLRHSASVISSYTPDGYACQVHLNESIFHATLPAAIPLNDGGFKGNSLELGHLEGDIPGRCVATSSYQRPANHVSFYLLFNLQTYSALSKSIGRAIGKNPILETKKMLLFRFPRFLSIQFPLSSETQNHSCGFILVVCLICPFILCTLSKVS